MKQLFTLFVVLLSACTFSAYAAIVDGTCGDSLTWTLNTKDSTLTISGTGAMMNYDYSYDYYYSPSAPWKDYKIYIKYVTLPDGLTSIGYSAFAECSSLTSITIPNSVTSIGGSAFEGCSSLTSITIPNSVTSIGSFAFHKCYSLTSITIPNSVTSIGVWAFYRCSSLTSVAIGNSVTSIEDKAFYQCSSLTSITIPNSVTSIGGEAFYSCSSLTSVTLGNSVTSIGGNAFYRCNIQEVTSYASTPPAAASCGLNQTAATLYVPAEYIGTYSNTLWWEDFKEIRALDADYVVTFVDWDGTVLASVGVAAGQAATAPAAPVREGYTFIGWDKDFSFVTSDMDVYAQYELNGAEKDLTLVFNDRDNNQVLSQTLSVIVPLAPEIEGFTFLYWKTIDARVDDVITLQAVYESNSPTAAPEVYVNPSNKAQKLIRNGQVYILYEDKQYTISGQVVK